VVKADGLAAGKGVAVCRSPGEAETAVRACLERRAFGAAGSRIIVEDLLEGEELSVLALCSGTALVPMVAAQDHKTVYDGDEGPNTGGMGAYAPAPLGDAALLEKVRDRVLLPTVRAMAARGVPLSGVLYAGLMIHEGEPSVLEFNVRFGDPETQPLLALLETDLLPLLSASAQGALTGREELAWHAGAAVCVVMTSGGYPGSYRTGLPIRGLEAAEDMDGVVVFHGGTKLDGGRLVTAGGRVLGVTALGADVAAARDLAYAAVDRIEFEHAHHRRDIAARAIGAAAGPRRAR
jgi:phosphoribosylamine--glycine ligase